MGSVTLFSPEWLEPVAIAEVAVVTPEPTPRGTWRRVGWKQATLTLAAPVAVPPAAQPTKVSRRAVRASPAMLARAEKRRREAGDKDKWAVVVIVVPPTRDAMEREARQIPNVPDYLGRVAFTAKGYGKDRDNFADVQAFIEHIEGMGRKWRTGP